MFIRNCNEKLFRDVIKREYCTFDVTVTITLHLNELILSKLNCILVFQPSSDWVFMYLWSFVFPES